MLQEIENATAEQLKERKAEFVERAQESGSAELATRFINARLDAKVRDQRLAEQAEQLAALQTAVQNSNQANSDMRKQLEGAAQLGKTFEEFREQVSKQVAALQEKLKAAEERAAKAEALASSRREVLGQIMNAITPVLVGE